MNGGTGVHDVVHGGEMMSYIYSFSLQHLSDNSERDIIYPCPSCPPQPIYLHCSFTRWDKRGMSNQKRNGQLVILGYLCQYKYFINLALFVKTNYSGYDEASHKTLRAMLRPIIMSMALLPSSTSSSCSLRRSSSRGLRNNPRRIN